MTAFETISKAIGKNEELQDDFFRQQRKLDDYEERLSILHNQLQQTTDNFGNKSRNRQNQSFASEMMNQTMQRNNLLSEALAEAKQTVRKESNRLEDENQNLYRKRSELI